METLQRIKELPGKKKTIKVLEENIDRKIFGIYLSNIFLDMSPEIRDTKNKIKWAISNSKTSS